MRTVDERGFKRKDCPVKYALDVLSGKWTMHILYILTENESTRFSELQRQVGNISALMLSRTLGELKEHGLVARRERRAIPPHVEYSLTDLGRAPALDTLGQWGRRAWLVSRSSAEPPEKIRRKRGQSDAGQEFFRTRAADALAHCGEPKTDRSAFV